MRPGVWVVLVVLVAASGFGVWRARTDGRFRGSADDGAWSGDSTPLPTDVVQDEESETPVASVLDGRLGDRATLLQFSSAFCAPCRATKRVLSDVAAAVPGVKHVEIDAESHLDVVRRLNILKTPTTLVLDRDQNVTQRAAGQPRKEHILAALEQAVG